MAASKLDGRELEVARDLLNGLSQRQIATKYSVSRDTVQRFLIKHKLPSRRFV